MTEFEGKKITFRVYDGEKVRTFTNKKIPTGEARKNAFSADSIFGHGNKTYPPYATTMYMILLSEMDKHGLVMETAETLTEKYQETDLRLTEVALAYLDLMGAIAIEKGAFYAEHYEEHKDYKGATCIRLQARKSDIDYFTAEKNRPIKQIERIEELYQGANNIDNDTWKFFHISDLAVHPPEAAD